MKTLDDYTNKIFELIKQIDSETVQIADKGGMLKISYRNKLEVDMYLSVNSDTKACKIMLYVTSFIFDGKKYSPQGHYAWIRRDSDKLSDLPESVNAEIVNLYNNLESSFEKALVFIQNIMNISDGNFRNNVMTAAKLLLSTQI